KKIKEKYNKEKLKISIFSNKGIYKKMPDGTTAIYSLDLPFEKEKMKKSKEGYEEKITYLDIKIPEYKKEIQWYHSEENNGCGVRKYALDFQGKFIVSVLDGDKKKDEILTYKNEDLKVIGETGSGEKVYGFADKNHPFLQKLHKAHIAAMSMFGDDGYDEKGKKKWMDYEDFIKELPIFFWDDPFGRRVAFVKSQTVMRFGLSCGAKPVIYLYPEKKQKISVTLDWKKRNLISIPTYKNKWEVMVKPNGNIEFEGKNYPYLFWEDGLFLKKKEDGFIVKKENMDLFLGEKLQILGLNQKEIAYFKEFWLDKMLEKPYYFVRFYTNEDMNFSAPITIIPKPDSIQRVFIDYKGLNEEIEIEEQELKPFRRKGFSVIEWGGNLQK
ncbi:hypothetical protein KGV55_03740, partial [Candidatus Gracilibacteria bacterium]|nr:hypothetical protein [Candidatus Gracilibacteria bacterium]